MTEAEVRAAVAMLMHAMQYARSSIGTWVLNKKKPTKDEMLQVMLTLKDAEDFIAEMCRGAQADDYLLDEQIRFSIH